MKEEIKVVAITKNLSSPHWHRLKYPFSKINGLDLDGKEIKIDFEEFNEGTFEKAKNYNILAYHWDIPLKINQLGELQARGVKLLFSLDDFWEFSETHPYYFEQNKRDFTAERVKSHMINADAVIVSTERLAVRAMKFNDNIAILPNFLDPLDFPNKKTESELLRVGLVGSVSHVPNWKLLKGTINRIAKNKDLSSKIEFHVVGRVEGDANWDEIIRMVTVKKNLKLVIKDFVPNEEYISIYEDVDCILMPLEQIEFNACRSALKLNECAITRTIPIGSSLYSGKELKGIVVCETALAYEQTLVKLLDKEYREKVLNYVTEINLKDANFEKRWENTKAVIGAVYTNDLSPKLQDVKIYSITYSPEQVAEYEKYDNSNIKTVEQWSYLFEYNPILDILSNKIDNLKDEDYLGILSWKFNQKSGLTKNFLMKTLKNKKYQEFDIINLTRPYKDLENNYLQWTDNYHPTFLEKFKVLCEHLGLSVIEPKHVVFSNMVLAKKSIYIEFGELVKKAIEFLETDMKEVAFENAKYTAGLNEEKLLEQTGLGYYTFHTFLLERLWSVWIENKLTFNFSSNPDDRLKVRNLFQ